MMSHCSLVQNTVKTHGAGLYSYVDLMPSATGGALPAPLVLRHCRVQGNVSKRAVFAAVDPASHDVLYVGWAFDAQLSRDPLKRLERRFARKIQDDSKLSVEAAAGDGLGPEDCARLTVAQLREALEARGFDATGLKAALVKRLTEATADARNK